VAVDVTQVSRVDTEPGELPETMAAWVIREEREGEPKDAFQLEEIEVPEPGAFEVIVRVMAAGVNYNNVWAALGKPVGVWRYGDHPEYGHHIGGSDASGVVWKVGAGRHPLAAGRRGRDPLQPGLLRGSRGARARPARRARRRRSGATRRPWGSFAQFTEGPGPAAAAQAARADLGGGRVLRPRVLHRLPDAAHALQPAGRPPRPDLGRRRRPRRLREPALQGGGRECVGVVSSAEKGELVKQLGAVDYIDRNEFAGMMRKGGETPEEEKERFNVSRAFDKRVREILGEKPDIVFEHVGAATFPDVGVHGQAVRQGRDLRRHHGLQPRTSTSGTCG
jgi:crotonyl-CoA carboxylase/reductase